MALSAEQQQYASEELGYTAEELAALPDREAERITKAHKGYLRQQDYSRKQNELQKAQQHLQQENDRFNRDIAEWGQMTAGEKAKAAELADRIEKADARAFMLEQKLRRAAEEAGRDPKEWLGDEPAKPPDPPPRTNEDLAGVHQMIGGMGDFNMTLTADLPAIAQEHFELTGERLDTRAFVAGIKEDFRKGKTQNVDPWRRWESQYAIPEKREAKRVADIDARIKQAREEGLAAGRSEAALPNTHPVGRSDSSSAAFRGLGPSKLGRPNPADHLASARAALAEGRYRSAGPGGVMPPGQKP